MNENKNILLIMPYGSVGGMERLALTFYEYYKFLGYEVKAIKFIKLESDIIDFGRDELFLNSKDFNDMSSLERYSFYLKAPFQLKKIINNYKINYSIAFGDMANLFSSLSFTKEYKIGSIHALKSVELTTPTTFNTLIKLGYKSSYKHLNKLVCISKSIKEDLVLNCNYKFDNLEVIYNPHDVKKIKDLSLEPLSDTEKDIFNNDVILFLGRLSIQKAPWHLINAFRLIKNDNPRLKLVFIGDGDYGVTTYIKKTIARHKLGERVLLLGRKKNPYKYILNSNVLALTSYYEGTPNVIVESIALGTPVVSSNCTEGIFELMSLSSVETNLTANKQVEAGIITPTFYKGVLEIPSLNEDSISKIENLFAQALQEVLKSKSIKDNLRKYQNELLDKFKLNSVCTAYLNN